MLSGGASGLGANASQDGVTLSESATPGSHGHPAARCSAFLSFHCISSVWWGQDGAGVGLPRSSDLPLPASGWEGGQCPRTPTLTARLTRRKARAGLPGRVWPRERVVGRVCCWGKWKMLFKYQEISHKASGPGSAVAVLLSVVGWWVTWGCLRDDGREDGWGLLAVE